MSGFLTQYFTLIPGLYTLQSIAYLTLVLSWPAFLLLERLWPVQPNTPRSNYWLNWRITASNLVLAPVFTTVVVIVTATWIGAIDLPRIPIPSGEISFGLPIVDVVLQAIAIFLIACFIGDFSYYWWHRAQHTVPFLWEIHKLHHSDENLNTSTIYRSHFLESAGQALFRGIIIGLIFQPDDSEQTLMALIFGNLMILLWDYLIHANVRFNFLHSLLPFFSTPQYHWIHHSRMPEHQDKNFAIWLPLYDVIFGSYYKPKVDEYPPTGLSSGEKIETVWEGQVGPLRAWGKSVRNRYPRSNSTK